jgi:hypothetical protein
MQLTILCKESSQPRQEQKGIQTGYSYLTMQLTILCKESSQPRQEQKGIQTGYSYLTMLSNSFAAFSFTALESSIFKCLRDECLLSHLVAKMKLIELVISQSCSEK